jgi:hypothetical protein
LNGKALTEGKCTLSLCAKKAGGTKNKQEVGAVAKKLLPLPVKYAKIHEEFDYRYWWLSALDGKSIKRKAVLYE